MDSVRIQNLSEFPASVQKQAFIDLHCPSGGPPVSDGRGKMLCEDSAWYGHDGYQMTLFDPPANPIDNWLARRRYHKARLKTFEEAARRLDNCLRPQGAYAVISEGFRWSTELYGDEPPYKNGRPDSDAALAILRAGVQEHKLALAALDLEPVAKSAAYAVSSQMA